MSPRRLGLSGLPLVALIFAVVAVVNARSQTTPGQTARQDTPPLPVDAAMKTLRLPAGYRVELVASEPLIQDPVVIDWDADGRLWAVEMPGYMIDIQASNELDPIGRVVVLEDTDDDGKMDKRTVFAEGLVLARALKVLDRGVLVGEPPNLWFMRDTNGDLKMDTKELVSDQFGRLQANVEHNANGLLWALDNCIYTSEVDIYLREKAGKFEVRKTLARGQWGLSQDDAGRVYRNTNESALYVDLVPTPYFLRNPNLRRTRGSYEFLGADNGLNTVWPIHPTPGVNRGYQVGVLRPDGRLAAFTAVAAPTVFRGHRLPPELYGNVFVVEPSANLVSRIIVTDDGQTLRARKAYADFEFIASTDERFRPVYLSSAPDGTLYVVDMYRGVIQHRGYITEYLRDQILSRKLEQPRGLGRIYRVVHDTTRRERRPALASATPGQLVETLSHPNGWWRDTAQRLLVERGDKSVVQALRKLAAGPEPRTRLHALWTLDGLDALEPDTVTRALGDPSRDVRVSALRLSERWLRELEHPIHAAVVKLSADEDWWVREQLAASLGELPRGSRETALAQILETHGSDPVVVDAALSGLAGGEASVLARMLTGSETPQRAAVVTMLAATILAGSDDASVHAVLDRIADSRQPMWQRAALMLGAEVSLLDADAPGMPPGRRRAAAAGAPCPTCPGGRAGPGGAPAFPRGSGGDLSAADVTTAGARGRGRSGSASRSLKLSREPALSALAGDTSDLGKRAANVLARLEWPGKPGASAPVAPLTAEEQQRFNDGRDIYNNLCVACHQPDGRGREKLAPSLLGSEFALGPPAVPIRVLMNGKEGAVGLMPPLGATLTDQQIAAVLTYIRREWGQTGSSVDPALVSQVRPLTAGRTRPWTDDELSNIAAAKE